MKQAASLHASFWVLVRRRCFMEQFSALFRSKDKQPVSYLIVDDSVFARKNLSKIVEGFGGKVAGEAGDGMTAIAEYDRVHPDLVLMDITMPQMEGIEPPKRFGPSHPRPRIILFFSVGNRETILPACQKGGGLLLQKPVRPEVYSE